MVEKSKLYEKMGLYNSKKETSEDYFKKAFGNTTNEISISENVDNYSLKEETLIKEDLFSTPKQEKTYEKIEEVKNAFGNAEITKSEMKKVKEVEVYEKFDEEGGYRNQYTKPSDINKISKEKVIEIQEIYKNKALESDEKKMIFVADSYLRAIPDNLSVGIQRDTVHRIMSVSGLSVDYLLEDARQRKMILSEVQMNTEELTKNIISENEEEIDKLMNQIEELEKIISDRKKLQIKQNKLIDEEKAKIQHIVDFINPKIEA